LDVADLRAANRATLNNGVDAIHPHDWFSERNAAQNVFTHTATSSSALCSSCLS